MTSFIYQDANLARSKEATYLHFVEVCGMLTVMDRKKKKVKIDVPNALCKALGWYFPLLAKMGVRSVEELIFTKYPNVCPYCREKPHNETKCKLMKGADATVSHQAVLQAASENRASMPKNLNEWQSMFSEIYPRALNAPAGFSTIALFEELGELAEAVRVFDRYPHYFYGEAADTFSYIMGLANEYNNLIDDTDVSFDFQAEYLSRYPGLCVNCGSRSCICPPIPSATIGRMAKELQIDIEIYQIKDRAIFAEEGENVAREVFESVGFVPQIGRRLPYDRGDLNAALVQFTYRLANASEGNNPEVAQRLRNQALQLGRSTRGADVSEGDHLDLLDTLREGWNAVSQDVQKEIREAGGQLSELTHFFDKRILIITANQDGDASRALRLDREVRAIREAFRRSEVASKPQMEVLMAATVSDLRRALLHHQFDIIHFSGHADDDGISLLDELGGEVVLDYDSLAEIIKKQKDVKCVVLNACHSLEKLEEAFAPLVIGMMDEIDDEAAIAFAEGFYDSIAAQKSPDEAFAEGMLSMKAKGFANSHVAKLREA